MKLIFYKSVAEFVAKLHQKIKFIDLGPMKHIGLDFDQQETTKFVGFAETSTQLTKKTNSKQVINNKKC